MRSKVISLFVGILLLAGVSTAGAGTIYFNTLSGGVSDLYTLTYSGGTTAAATLVGTIKSGSSNLSITDIGYDFTTGKMFAISASTTSTNSNLYTLNFSNPVGGLGGVVAATAVGLTGSTGVKNLQGLTVAANGTIYAGSNPSSGAGDLYTLDPSNGSVTSTKSFGSSNGHVLRDYGDLAFSPTGTLYGVFNWVGETGTPGNNHLGTVITGTGQASPFSVGTGFTGADGIVFEGNTLYMVKHGGNLVSLDPTTGAVIFSNVVIKAGTTTIKNEYGLTYVPLPSTLLLLGSGLVGLGFWRRRRFKA